MAERRCPVCHSTSVRRSRRKTLFERLLLPLVRRRPYRCQRCDGRFYAPVSQAGPGPDADAEEKPTLAA